MLYARGTGSSFRSHFMLGSPPGSVMLARADMKRGHSKRFRRYVFFPSNISLGCHCIFLPRCVAYDNMTASIDPSSRTILGPLTTTFSAPATCTVGQRACSTCNYAWQAQTCYSAGAGGSETYGVKDATQCWPPTSSGLPEPTPPLWGWGFLFSRSYLPNWIYVCMFCHGWKCPHVDARMELSSRRDCSGMLSEVCPRLQIIPNLETYVQNLTISQSICLHEQPTKCQYLPVRYFFNKRTRHDLRIRNHF